MATIGSLVEDLRAKRMDLLTVKARVESYIDRMVESGEGKESTLRIDVYRRIGRKLNEDFRLCAAPVLGAEPEDIGEPLVRFGTSLVANTLLKARAGSGKTTALVVKAKFLVEVLGVDPARIGFLVFNRKAREDIQKRFERIKGFDASRIRIRTFHAFARAVLLERGIDARSIFFDADSEQIKGNTDIIREIAFRHLSSDFLSFCRTTCRLQELEADEVARWIGASAGFLRARGETRSRGALLGDSFLTRAEIAATQIEEALTKQGIYDGDLCLKTAASELQNHDVRSAAADDLDVLFVDEFQDVNKFFFDLIQAIRQRNNNLIVNAVGDDWQAINGYAGAETMFFETFHENFKPAATTVLPTNRRSAKGIVELGNAIMFGRGERAEALESVEEGDVCLMTSMDTFGSSKEERLALHDWVLESIAERLRKPERVALIARGQYAYKKSLRNWRDEVMKRLSIPRNGSPSIDVFTAHASKGLEWDHVIIMDGTTGAFPNYHPAHRLTEAIRPMAERMDEERCLLYVACTRARKRLTILAPSYKRGSTYVVSPSDFFPANLSRNAVAR